MLTSAGLIRAAAVEKLADQVWPDYEEEEEEDLILANRRAGILRDSVGVFGRPERWFRLEDTAHLLPLDISVSPQNIYRNKGECSKQFDRVMGHAGVSERRDGPVHELVNDTVASCFDILKDLPKLYDKIYADFPDAYNANGYRFGSSSIVKIYDPTRREAAKDKSGFVVTQPTTSFIGEKVKHRYPDGLIMPLVYGLQGLMTIRDKKVVWATDPFEFLDKYFKDIAGAYRIVLDLARFDPQKLAKNEASHEFAVGEFEKALLKHEVKAA